MKNKQLVYICSGIGSVFDSQVIELLNGICGKKLFHKTYLLLGYSKKNEKLKLNNEKIHPNLIIIFFKIYPNYPFYNFLNRYALRKALKSINISDVNTVFHIREEILTWHLLSILNESYFDKILPDIRGANLEEVIQFFGYNYFREKLKVWNYRKATKSLRKVKRISVVSTSLKQYLVDNYQIKPENIFITSCLAGKYFSVNSERRKKVRSELNLEENDILLVFSSGGEANWQNINALKYFARKNIKLLNLSKKQLSYDNVINKFVNYYEMPDYLNAADIAILWRNESVVNKVASPVKFSEYLCCGLPVITNDNIDLVKDVITKNNIGLVLNNIDEFDEENINKSIQIDRNSISQIGRDNYGFEAILEKYQSLYNQL